MPERDRATVDIGLCEIETKVTDNGERLGSKGLVGLDKIDG